MNHYVVVVELKKHSWTIGPFFNRPIAQGVVDKALAMSPLVSAWIEPMLSYSEYLREATTVLTEQER